MDDRSFETTYAQMLDGELARALRSRRTLVPEARAALDREIVRRQLDPEKLRKQKPRDPEKHRPPTVLEMRLGKKRLRWPSLLGLMAASIVLIATLDRLHVPQFFWPIVITLMVPVATAVGFKELLRRPWFWAILAAIVAVHIVLFRLYGWPPGERWVPGRSIAGLVTLELIPIFALIWRIEKRWERLERSRSKTQVQEP